MSDSILLIGDYDIINNHHDKLSQFIYTTLFCLMVTTIKKACQCITMGI